MTGPVPIAAVTQSLNVGGSTTFLLNLGRALREQGMALPIVCLQETNEMAEDFAAAGVPVECMARRRYIYEDRTLRTYQYLRERRPAAVLACLGAESFEVLRLLPPGVQRLGIIQSHDPGPYRTVNQYRPWLDGMVGVSRTICEQLVKEEKFARVAHIPYGIRFGPMTERAPRTAGSPLRLIYVGRMAELQKRVSRLVALTRCLTERNLAFEFVFAGGGPELAATREALREIRQVKFLGDVANRRMAELLREQDVFVLLSDFEGLPLSLLEAMGEGVVPVTSDLESGLRDIVTGQTGIRLPVGDVKAAADAIIALAGDPARWAALSQGACRLAREDYSADRMAGRYLKLAGEGPQPAAEWPQTVAVPSPLGLRASLYTGWPRRMRRWIKSLGTAS